VHERKNDLGKGKAMKSWMLLERIQADVLGSDGEFLTRGKVRRRILSGSV
jgi:hypothetical protein